MFALVGDFCSESSPISRAARAWTLGNGPLNEEAFLL